MSGGGRGRWRTTRCGGVAAGRADRHRGARKESRVRVIVLSTQPGWGGGEAQAQSLLEGLAASRVDVVLAAPQASPLFERACAAGLACAPLPHRGMHPRNLLALLRLLWRQRPDVLHANDAHAVTLGALSRFAAPRLVRVAMRHTSFPMRSASKYRVFDRVLCVSPEAVEQCRRSGLCADRLRLAPCGVDVRLFAVGDRHRARERLGLTDGEHLVLSVGNLLPVKGHAELIRAMPLVLRHRPRSRLLIAGEGPERARLEALVKELGLERCVTLPGFCPDVPELLAACDVFVLPSKSEGLPVSALEAMAARRPVVVTPFASAEYLAGHPDPSLWIARSHEAAELAAAVLAALDGGEAARVRIERAYRRVVDEFSREALVRRVLDVYREATARVSRAA